MLGEIVEKIKLSRYGLLSNFRLFCSFRYRTGFFGGETAVQKGVFSSRSGGGRSRQAQARFAHAKADSVQKGRRICCVNDNIVI